jgi:two-component system sensor histidine kinase HydH
MTLAGAKLGRSFVRAGPLGIAILLGILLIASSALSYRDALRAAGIVSEREGIRLFQRIQLMIAARGESTVSAGAVREALEGNRTFGLTYIGVYNLNSDDRALPVAEAGRALLAASSPPIGTPAIGKDRVRMAFGPPPHGFLDPPLPYGAFTPVPGLPPPPPPPLLNSRLAIEFEPIASMDAVHRGLAGLCLSIGASLLLTLAALILARRAERAERAESELIAQRQLALLGTMSAVLAHEIRNPLASLKGHAQLLAERVADADLAPRIDRVVAEAVRLEHLTADLLEFARSGAIHVVPSDPRAVIERAVQGTEPSRIDVDVARAPAQWPLDADRMHQVLTNMLDNALAVTSPPDRVQLTASFGEGGLVFTVRDRGPGVPATERQQIFEPFHTTKTRGTGLGLAVAKRIVEMHGGSVNVGDADGGGALFRICVPGRAAAVAT